MGSSESRQRTTMEEEINNRMNRLKADRARRARQFRVVVRGLRSSGKTLLIDVIKSSCYFSVSTNFSEQFAFRMGPPSLVWQTLRKFLQDFYQLYVVSKLGLDKFMEAEYCALTDLDYEELNSIESHALMENVYRGMQRIVVLSNREMLEWWQTLPHGSLNYNMLMSFLEREAFPLLDAQLLPQLLPRDLLKIHRPTRGFSETQLWLGSLNVEVIEANPNPTSQRRNWLASIADSQLLLVAWDLSTVVDLDALEAAAQHFGGCANSKWMSPMSLVLVPTHWDVFVHVFQSPHLAQTFAYDAESGPRRCYSRVLQRFLHLADIVPTKWFHVSDPVCSLNPSSGISLSHHIAAFTRGDVPPVYPSLLPVIDQWSSKVHLFYPQVIRDAVFAVLLCLRGILPRDIVLIIVKILCEQWPLLPCLDYDAEIIGQFEQDAQEI